MIVESALQDIVDKKQYTCLKIINSQVNIVY